jgi:hypothetical protein
LHFPAFLPLQSGFSSGFYSPRAKNVRMTKGAGRAGAVRGFVATPRRLRQKILSLSSAFYMRLIRYMKDTDLAPTSVGARGLGCLQARSPYRGDTDYLFGVSLYRANTPNEGREGHREGTGKALSRHPCRAPGTAPFSTAGRPRRCGFCWHRVIAPWLPGSPCGRAPCRRGGWRSPAGRNWKHSGWG